MKHMRFCVWIKFVNTNTSMYKQVLFFQNGFNIAVFIFVVLRLSTAMSIKCFDQSVRFSLLFKKKVYVFKT